MSAAEAIVKQDFWSTRDMGLAAYIAMGQPVIRTEWDEDGQCYWIFEETTHVVDCVMAYSGNEEVELPPRQLIESYQRLNGQLKRDGRLRRHS